MIDTQTTGVYGELIDLDELYESVSDRVTLINQFDVTDDEEKDRLNKMLFVRCEDDILDVTPQCQCGFYHGEVYRDQYCPECRTIVTTTAEQRFESSLWMEVPEGVTSFISPIVWYLLNTNIRLYEFKLLRWLADSSYVYKPKVREVEKIERLMQVFHDMGWKRSLNEFIARFDEIMQVIYNLRIPIDNQRKNDIQLFKNRKKRDTMIMFVERFKHRFFPRHLPIPSRLVFVTEKNSAYMQVDSTVAVGIDPIRTLTSMTVKSRPIKQQVKENRTVRIVDQFATYYIDYFKNNIGRKPGMFRKQVLGSRLDYTGRAVISGISEPHHYTDLHFPWGLSTLLFKPQITVKLVKKYGMSVQQSEHFIQTHTRRYHPLLDKVFKELLEEAGKGPELDEHVHRMIPNIKPGIETLFQRNPSLEPASAQKLRIVKIKTEVEDISIGVSQNVLVGFNADFDGDEMNVFLLMDEKERRQFVMLAPEMSILDINKPFKFSKNVKLPAPVVATIASWMHENHP